MKGVCVCVWGGRALGFTYPLADNRTRDLAPPNVRPVVSAARRRNAVHTNRLFGNRHALRTRFHRSLADRHCTAFERRNVYGGRFSSSVRQKVNTAFIRLNTGDIAPRTNELFCVLFIAGLLNPGNLAGLRIRGD